jgi:diphosphomevalonate decarboxylase
VGSISLTLEALKTETRVTINPGLEKDQLLINEKPASESQRRRVENFLDIIREKSGDHFYVDVASVNNFPTGAGLASSASAFAALSLAATKAAGLRMDKKDLSELSRRGSGSASRSVFGGIVEMQKGKDQEGRDDFAVQIASPDYWDLRVIILITSAEEKKVGSTEAMKLSADTSPYYENWIKTSDKDLEEMRTAISEKDMEKLGDLAEYSALKMHALTLSSRPPVLYWNRTTLQLIEEVRALRKKGIPAYFTIDAGPQVKVITLGDHVSALINHFTDIQGIEKYIESKLGPDAVLIGDDH